MQAVANELALASHFDVLCCPECHGELVAAADRVSCIACGQSYPSDGGFFNFAPKVPRVSQQSLGQRKMEDPSSVPNYESVQRKHYVRWMGKTQLESFGAPEENTYLERFVRPTNGGKVLDLACGSGLATRQLVARFGANRVIGLDVSFAMLGLARDAVPGCWLLRGSASHLPIRSATLDAVTCWDALQALPDPARAIAEVGRCLRPGGTFTCFTFEKSRGPYGLIQGLLAAVIGSKIYHLEALSALLTRAKLELIDHGGPGQILLLTARKC